MLIKCYECSAEVSDLASSCPKCGAPIGANASALTKYRCFVEEVLCKLTKPRCEYDNVAIDKILSIAKKFEHAEQRIARERISHVIHSEFFAKHRRNGCIESYSCIGDECYAWSGCNVEDKNVMQCVFYRQVLKLLQHHNDEMLSDALGCRDLLLDMLACAGWFEMSSSDKALSRYNGVRNYIYAARRNPVDENNKVESQWRKLLLACDEKVIQDQDLIIEHLRFLYHKNSYNCVVCHNAVSDIRYFYRNNLENYSPADCGLVTFVVDEPRCKNCADRSEELEAEKSLLDSEYDRLCREYRELEDSFWSFGKKDKLNLLLQKMRGIRARISRCNDELWTPHHFIVSDEIERLFPYENSYLGSRGSYYVAEKLPTKFEFLAH